jgi:protein TonB
MAYVDQRTGRNQRAVVMTVVAAIQGGAIVALINGLAVNFIKPAAIPNPQTTDVPVTMPLPVPPPPPDKEAIEQPRQPDLGTPPIDLSGGQLRDPLPPMPLPPQPMPTYVPDPPAPTPTATAAPRAPKPRNAPGSWATPNDYPARDLREGNQGVTRFMLTIGVDGKVQSCAVTASSGHPGLDRAACDNISRRARFEPATDSSGSRVPGTYSGSIRWQIPRG